MPERLGAVQEETRAAARTCSGFGPHQPVCQLKACGAILHLSPGGQQKPLGTAEARQGEGCAPVAEQCPQHAPTTRRWEGRLQPGALGALGTGTELPLQQHACRALETRSWVLKARSRTPEHQNTLLILCLSHVLWQRLD